MNRYSITEVAKQKGVLRETVFRAMKTGKLNAERIGHFWVIYDDEKLTAYIPDGGGPKRVSPLRCPNCGRSVVKVNDDQREYYACIRCKKHWTDDEVGATS